jgi:hypothetical protein
LNFPMVQTESASWGRLASSAFFTCRQHASHSRRIPLRNYVMLPAAIEQERLFVAERLLSEIERRHGLPRQVNREIHSVIVDRFLTAYLPETRDGEPAPSALEFAFAPSLAEALNLMRGVVTETETGFGAALYIHDLDTENGGPAYRVESTTASSESRS